MNRDVFYEIKNHYGAIAEELLNQAKQARLLENSSDVGTEREGSYLSFLKRHLSRTCDAFLGGYIFDLQGNKSKQMDIIITNGNTPRFQMSGGNKQIAPLEGTIGVVESKSMLNRRELRDALEKCASIPDMPDPKGILSPSIKGNHQLWFDMPYKIIFAYNGNEKENIVNNVNEFYSEYSDIPVNRRPNIIHVLGKYVVLRTRPGMTVFNSDGTPVPNQPSMGEYRWFDRGSDIVAITWTLNELQDNDFLIRHSMFKYSQWIDGIVDRIIREGP